MRSTPRLRTEHPTLNSQNAFLPCGVGSCAVVELSLSLNPRKPESFEDLARCIAAQEIQELLRLLWMRGCADDGDGIENARTLGSRDDPRDRGSGPQPCVRPIHHAGLAPPPLHLPH